MTTLSLSLTHSLAVLFLFPRSFYLITFPDSEIEFLKDDSSNFMCSLEE